jgi:hypothetical protein
VLEGKSSIADFRDRPGMIDAQILEDAGCILMTKTCEKHGTFRDVLSTNADFFKRMESLYVGQDFRCAGSEPLHESRAIVDSNRARSDSDRRFDESLQSEMFAMLHGCESCDVCP